VELEGEAADLDEKDVALDQSVEDRLDGRASAHL
jgi:hypothetical protein